MNEHEQKIRERAHAIWEREGRPEGREQEHWERAERELRGEGSLGGTDPAGSSEARGPGVSPAPEGAGDGAIPGASPAVGKGRKGGGSKAGASTSTSRERTRRGFVGPDA